ncbi:MAG: hypothetical protein IPH52_16235 [Leptospiraceae bacterium]|nr:hypothetical protein [Leptospiraceae bacterium]MBP6738799.1 hypothetical protein [Leptospiraceae bacterium]
MITLIKIFLGNVAGVVGDILALAVLVKRAIQQVFVYIFTGNGDTSRTSQYAGSVIVWEGGLLVIQIPLCPPLKKGVLF